MARHDYEVNLKAEIEIAALHAKLDEIRANELVHELYLGSSYRAEAEHG